MALKATKSGHTSEGNVPRPKGGTMRSDYPRSKTKIPKMTNNGTPTTEVKSLREKGKKIPLPKTVCYAQGPQVVK